MSKLENCIDCIEHNAKSNNSFVDNDTRMFFASICTNCTAGVVPKHIPQQQVIRYLKAVLKRNNITIRRQNERTTIQNN